jgi:hypothetical protein
VVAARKRARSFRKLAPIAIRYLTTPDHAPRWHDGLVSGQRLLGLRLRRQQPLDIGAVASGADRHAGDGREDVAIVRASSTCLEYEEHGRSVQCSRGQWRPGLRAVPLRRGARCERSPVGLAQPSRRFPGLVLPQRLGPEHGLSPPRVPYTPIAGAEWSGNIAAAVGLAGGRGISEHSLPPAKRP